MTRALRLLPALTLAAVLTITASAEYELARTVLALPPGIAWALPVAIDSYVLTAFRSGRDVRPARAVMAGALTAAMGAHLVTAGRPSGHALPVVVTAPAATGIMIVLVVVAWRVHVLIDPATTSKGSDQVPDAPDVPAAPGALASTPTHLARPSAGARGESPSTRPLAASTPAVAADASAATANASIAMNESERMHSGSAAAPPSPSSSPTRRSGAAAASSAAPTTKATAAVGASDEQILAALNGPPPSIRALMRDHGIGQARATRIHQAASRDRNQQNNYGDPEEPQDSPDRSNSKIEREEPMQEPGEAMNERRPENQGIEEQDTHTCITDRVGQSGSTTGEKVPDSPVITLPLWEGK
jgi:hypothetical protein